MKTTERQNPRFGPGELPVEYTPLNEKTIITGCKYGPLDYAISMKSHGHHMEYVLKGNKKHTLGDSDFLYLFEFWPLPRVMSRWYFGRLNEVISIKAQRTVLKRPFPGDIIIGETIAKSVIRRRGLCFGYFASNAFNDKNELLMSSNDILLLVNGCDECDLRKAIQDTLCNRKYLDRNMEIERIGSWDLQMRFQWSENKWSNNIHTDGYAQSLGYNRGLVEGPGLADIVCSFDLDYRTSANVFKISWEHTGPLYVGLNIILVRQRTEDINKRIYFLCDANSNLEQGNPVLMRLEVEDL